MTDTVLFNLCEDLTLKSIPREDQCPSGTRCCLTKVNKRPGQEDRTVAVIPVAQTASLNFASSLLSSSQGVSLIFHGASYPPSGEDSKPQSLNVTLLCAKEESSPKFISYLNSQVKIEWSAPEACGSNGDEGGKDGGDPSGGDDPKDSESVGSGIGWFFLVLLLALAAYFGLGAYYNYSTYGASGMDLIPYPSGDAARAAYQGFCDRGEVKVVDADTLARNRNRAESNGNHAPNPVQGRPQSVAAAESRGPTQQEPHAVPEQRRAPSPVFSIPESTTVVSDEQNNTNEQGRRPLGTPESDVPVAATPASQQPHIPTSTPSQPPTSFVLPDSSPIRAAPIRRTRPLLIQRDVDSDLSEPESLVSVVIVDRTNRPGPSPVIPTSPRPLVTPNSPKIRSRSTETSVSQRSSSSQGSFQIYPYDSSGSSSFASVSRSVIVSTEESDEGGYPSGTDSSGPEDVTPRKRPPPARSHKDKGKAKATQSSLVLISSDEDNLSNDPDSDAESSVLVPPNVSPSPEEIGGSPEIVDVNSIPQSRSPSGSSRRSRSTRASRERNHATYTPSADNYSAGGRESRASAISAPATITLEELGFSQSHMPARVYSPGRDPRSPMKGTVLVPDMEK
ncbi:type II membrane protein [Marasmius tenuissimus]|uniref:Autophagy-related protein 27 n=1 Tax=Marasmius tenuissimus TaxID=585030 RepID=A0ABR3AG41_9AGAR